MPSGFLKMTTVLVHLRAKPQNRDRGSKILKRNFVFFFLKVLKLNFGDESKITNDNQ
jgi:hypothetical protein